MEKLIMGIDPGTNFMGYAILKTTGKNCKPELVVSGVVDMKKMSDPYLKLQRVFPVSAHCKSLILTIRTNWLSNRNSTVRTSSLC